MFNIFKVLRVRDEVRNNKMLGWLLDPCGDHGLEDQFLSGFMGKLGIGLSGDKVDVDQEPLLEDKARNIHRYPDIKIETDNFYIVIENKVSMGSIDNPELVDQSELGRVAAGTKEFIHIFITPNRNISDETKAILSQRNILHITWREISDLLTDISSSHSSEPVGQILSQYRDFVEQFVLRFPEINLASLMRFLENAPQSEEEKGATWQALREFYERIAEEVRARSLLPQLRTYIHRGDRYLMFYPEGEEYEIYAQLGKEEAFVGLVSYNAEARERLRAWVRDNEHRLQSAIPNAWIIADRTSSKWVELKKQEVIGDEDLISEKVPLSLQESANWEKVGLAIADAMVRHVTAYYPDIRKLF